MIRLVLGFWLGAMPAGRPAIDSPGWQEIYELPEAEGWFATVWANDDGWVAAGKNVIVKGGAAGIDRATLPGKAVLGIGRAGSEIFALGADQLILRFDGRGWVQEHFDPAPAKASARQKHTYVLHSIRTTNPDAATPLMAYGPWRVLLRQPDTKWSQPSEPERNRLSQLAQFGPEVARPAKCAPAAWW